MSIRPCGEETAVDTTVTGIGSVVVAELRAAGYMESTIGQYEKSIKALACFAQEHGGVTRLPWVLRSRR